MNEYPLYNVEAEEACLGAAMLYRSAAATVFGTLTAGDYGLPTHGAIHTAAAELYRAGHATDAVTVQGALVAAGSAEGISPGTLVALVAGAPGATNISGHVAIVADLAFRRRAAAEATAYGRELLDPTRDPGETVDVHRARLASLDSPLLARAPGDVAIDDYIDAPPPDDGEAVVPGLLTAEDRVIVVAGEGIGKSELTRQLVVTAAYGLQPFLFAPVPPVPTLLVDLENPSGVLRYRLRVLGQLARQRTTRERAAGTLWHRPGGIDLRRRADRIAFEDILQRCRPKLVALGPLYKAYARRGNETEEQVASEVQAVFDDLRTRYGFALVLEHHTPQGTGGSRELRPYGSSLWLRWPEFGLALRQDSDRPKEVLHVERWRGDRVKARWPEQLHRGRQWPWEGWWDEQW